MFRLLSFFLISCTAAAAAAVDDAIVYIECFDDAGDMVSTGSGVIVSDQGHVLSARHVFYPPPEQTRAHACRGSIGVADSNTTSRLVVPERPDMGFDALVAQFAGSMDFVPMRYCEFGDEAIRMRIFAAGFPGGTKTGKPSFRAGVISTTYLDPLGRVETDGLTTRGMSGGPVVSEDGTQLVGIVTGAEFDAIGTPIYAITPVSEFANLFRELQATGTSCAAACDAAQTELLARIDKLEADLRRERNPFSEIARLQYTHILRIECEGEEGTSRGTGFLVSDQGHVVTAGHLLGTGSSCTTSLQRGQVIPLTVREVSARFDAALLQLPPNMQPVVEESQSVGKFVFRSVTAAELGSELASIGYAGREQRIVPTFRRGFLATNFPSEAGSVEAVIDATIGMAGAPVFGRDSSLIGMITGAEFDLTGIRDYTGILSSDALAEEFSGYIQLAD